MNVLILANYEHVDFLREYTKYFTEGHSFRMYRNKLELEDYKDYDIGISFMYQYKVPKEQIEHRPWINFHPAPLPEYKGRNLCYHAIMNGETKFGATIHYMDENFDSGSIIWIDWFEILGSNTAEDVHEQSINISKAQFKRYLPRILNGEVFSTTKNDGGKYYYKHPIKDEILLNPMQMREIRAITYKSYYPVVNIGGKRFKVVPE